MPTISRFWVYAAPIGYSIGCTIGLVYNHRIKLAIVLGVINLPYIIVIERLICLYNKLVRSYRITDQLTGDLKVGEWCNLTSLKDKDLILWNRRQGKRGKPV